MNDADAAFARTTITVPRDLRRRMRRVGRRINWSAVACDAFAAAIDDLEAEEKETQMMEMPSMDDAVNRLKQLKAINTEQSGAAPPAGYEDGYLLGRRWAMAAATPHELDRLEEFWATRSQQPVSSPEDGRALFRAMTLRILNAEDSKSDGRKRGKAFWQRVGLPERPKDRAMFIGLGRGFAEGAVGFWREVKDKI